MREKSTVILILAPVMLLAIALISTFLSLDSPLLRAIMPISFYGMWFSLYLILTGHYQRLKLEKQQADAKISELTKELERI